jgi:hypothetical protein
MDSAYNVRVDAATEMVAVFCEAGKTPAGVKAAVPTIRVIGPSVGEWKRIDLEMEWGFQPGTEKTDFDSRLEPYMAMIGPVSPLAGDKGTAVNGAGDFRPTKMGLSPSVVRAMPDEASSYRCCTPPTVARVWTVVLPFGPRRPVSRFAFATWKTDRS